MPAVNRAYEPSVVPCKLKRAHASVGAVAAAVRGRAGPSLPVAGRGEHKYEKGPPELPAPKPRAYVPSWLSTRTTVVFPDPGTGPVAVTGALDVAPSDTKARVALDKTPAHRTRTGAGTLPDAWPPESCH